MEAPITIIEPGKGVSRYWSELWHYRSLLGFLAWRDIKVRYRQAVLSIAWAVIQPAVQTLLLTFVFSRIAGFSDADTPYSLVVLSGLLPWQFFSNAFSNSGGSLLQNSHLVTKVYFPRLVIPLSSVAVALVDSAIVLLLTLAYASWLGRWPTWHLLALPFFLLPLLMLTLGCGLWSTVLTIKYRDFRFITPFLIQAGFFVTPIGFRTGGLGRWTWLLELNPLTGIVEGFRWSLLGSGPFPSYASLSISFAGGILLLAGGLAYFRRSEKQFADII